MIGAPIGVYMICLSSIPPACKILVIGLAVVLEYVCLRWVGLYSKTVFHSKSIAWWTEPVSWFVDTLASLRSLSYRVLFSHSVSFILPFSQSNSEADRQLVSQFVCLSVCQSVFLVTQPLLKVAPYFECCFAFVFTPSPLQLIKCNIISVKSLGFSIEL